MEVFIIMKVTENIKEIAVKAGMLMAKVDTNTTCLWINYQPKEIEAIVKIRKRHTNKGIILPIHMI